MPNVEIPLVGPTYTSRSLPVANQCTENFYIEVNQEAETIAAFQPFPGLKLFGTAGVGTNRGQGVHDGLFYVINGTTLHSVDSVGNSTSIGTIPGAERCVLESDDTNLVITTSTGKPITWDGATLTIGSDVDLANSSTVTYINRRVVYDGDNQDLIFPDLDTPLTVNSANITRADSTSDKTLAVIAKQSQLFAFKQKSIIPYYNSGTGNPPYDPIQNSIQSIGLKAIHSISTNKDFIYFLGSDLMIYRLTGLQSQPIGNPAIGQAIAGYPNPENAFGNCFTFHDQNFYQITFPGSATWLFSEDAGWTNLSYDTTREPHLMNGYSFIYDKHLVCDRQTTGNIYELDFDTFTDNSKTIIRRRDTAKITARTLGLSGREVTMNRLEILVETGVGVITGQGSDPMIMMQFSDDGGRSWSAEQWKSIGALGDYIVEVEWHDLGTFKERMFRFQMSDPVKWVLRSANADVEAGIV